MATRYKTPAAFRQALEQRLKRIADERGVPLNTLRLKVVIERMLARLFASPGAPWLLKGGYAMELRYRPNARATKDIDLSLVAGEDIAKIRDRMQEAAGRDLGDFFSFRIGVASQELQGAPAGGARFPVQSDVAGKNFGRFHLDVGMGDALVGPAERLVGDDLLAFAGVEPATALAIPRAQQFAEKLHALTFPWSDRTNTRSKDLVDLVLIIEREPPESRAVREAVERVFDVRRTHAIPETISEPPLEWSSEFAVMAEEANIESRSVSDAHRRLVEFWETVRPT